MFGESESKGSKNGSFFFVYATKRGVCGGVEVRSVLDRYPSGCVANLHFIQHCCLTSAHVASMYTLLLLVLDVCWIMCELRGCFNCRSLSRHTYAADGSCVLLHVLCLPNRVVQSLENTRMVLFAALFRALC